MRCSQEFWCLYGKYYIVSGIFFQDRSFVQENVFTDHIITYILKDFFFQTNRCALIYEAWSRSKFIISSLSLHPCYFLTSWWLNTNAYSQQILYPLYFKSGTADMYIMRTQNQRIFQLYSQCYRGNVLLH